MWQDEPVFYRRKYYAVQGSGNDKRRRSLRCTDLDVARRRLNDLIKADTKKPVLITDIFALYTEEKENKYERLKYIWRVLKPYFGHLRPDQVTRKLCKQYAEKRQVADNTIIRDLGALRSALRWFDPDTPARFAFPKAPQPKDRSLTEDEMRRLLEAAISPHIKLFIILALCTSARKAALLELTWDRVDLERNQIDLGSGSGNKRRAIVPINATARAHLQKAYKARLTDYVIEFRGKPIKDVKTGFDATARRAKINDISPNVLRHTAAVWMAEDRVPMSEIAQYMGHSSTKITERVYARYSPDYLQKGCVFT